MKCLSLRYVLIVVLLFTINATTMAQDVVSSINTAMKTGNAGVLSSHLSASVDLTLVDDEGTYSSSVVMQKLQTFFTNHSPRAYETRHQTTAPNGSKYIIANLVTTNGTFRVHILMDSNRIKELCIEL